MSKSKRQRIRKKASKRNEAEASEMEMQKRQEMLNTLIEEAETLIDSFNYDEAETKLKEACSLSANNVKALEMLSGVLIEKGDWIEAQNLLKKCTEIAPNEGYSKYFSLGQLSEGEESLQFYEKGIQIIKKEIENMENVEPSEKKDVKILIRALSDAHCSISEIFMTDCCFAEDAETKCLNAIEAAINSDPSNPEAYQCRCNFHLVKEETNEAKEAVEKCLSLWLPLHESLRDGEAGASEENNIPSYDCRIKISKLLIELEMFEEGTKVLDGLIEEDDEVVEVWYLLGWMNYIQGDEYKLNAHYYLNKAKKVSIKTGMDELDYLAHVNELLEELKSVAPLDEEEEEEVEAVDYNEWEDFSSSESEKEMET